MKVTYKNFEKAKNLVELKWKNDNFEKLITLRELFEELEESKRLMLEEFFKNYKDETEK